MTNNIKKIPPQIDESYSHHQQEEDKRIPTSPYVIKAIITDMEEPVRHELYSSYRDMYITQHGTQGHTLHLNDLDIGYWHSRSKTSYVLLTLCLYVHGGNPPDSVKYDHCARLECWIDPLTLNPVKACEIIGKVLVSQFETLYSRAIYKLFLDPTSDHLTKVSSSIRKNAKDDRILFHYNGHGVPKPTDKGEIWMFNKSFTQYIPLSLYELQTAIGFPSMYVFDCSSAGLAVEWFLTFLEQRREENSDVNLDCIILGACSINEELPTNPDLPADVFTSCLTTPVKMAIKWYASHTVITGITTEMIDNALRDFNDQNINDRRTPYGELSWIFSAITDTIAWDVFNKEDFQKLFRQDQLVSILCRNYLLAERILRSCNCTPVSHPVFPVTYNHHLWQSWDLVMDIFLSYLTKPNMIEYPPSTFFDDQLIAFSVWLEFGSEQKKPPEQLPIIMKILLSQQYQVRALELLKKFLDMGAWAVDQALEVGLFPYMVNLLQSQADISDILVFIWAKVFAVDISIQYHLVKNNHQHYFIKILSDETANIETKISAAFIVSCISNNYRPGKQACLNNQLIPISLANTSNEDERLKKWSILCLGKLWEDFPMAKEQAIENDAHEILCELLNDQFPDVRAAAIFALGTFINADISKDSIELNIGLTLNQSLYNSSPLVRRELIITTSYLIAQYRNRFVKIVKQNLLKKRKGDSAVQNISDLNPEDPYYQIWNTLVKALISDPFVQNAELANNLLISKIREQAESQLEPTPVSTPKRTGSLTSKFGSFFSKSPGVNTTNEIRPDGSDSYSDMDLTDQKSYIYEVSCNYFRKPVLEKLDRQTMYTRKRDVPIGRIDKEISILENAGDEIEQLVFHPRENVVVSYDKLNGFNVWNWENEKKMNSWTLNTVRKVNQLDIINQDQRNPLLCAGTDDAIIRVWNNFCTSEEVVTAWRAFNREEHLLPFECITNTCMGLVTEWQEQFCYASGPIDVIKIWDVDKEYAIRDIPTRIESCVMSLKSTANKSGIIAGFHDGHIRQYDSRQHSTRAICIESENRGWINNMVVVNEVEIIAADSHGFLKKWDLRRPETPVYSKQVEKEGVLTSAEFHIKSENIALGSQEQKIRILNFDGEEQNIIRYHDGFLGQRVAPVSALRFHETKTVLAVGFTDSVLSIFTGQPI
eukprot:TRINITY_DN3324_c0_g1_i1.p2 TRINITY_DN3324_c0_g1~~TRINITY_DN3324_c0_g1_i1.p2  ORF type:complete len:1178 (-),score=237.26 TRINITY_DN3324_c0_g1_i1:3580-7074(-)